MYYERAIDKTSRNFNKLFRSSFVFNSSNNNLINIKIMEIYKDIKGYEGMYQVSNLGNVKSLKRKGRKNERLLKPTINSHGYLTVCLCKDKTQRVVKIHQLVCVAFLNHVPNGYKGLIVDHRNNDKLDNRLGNLQLVTARHNSSKDRKGTSKYTGVSWRKDRNKWRAYITINYKIIHLGNFDNEIDAHNEYQKALKNHLKTL